MTREVATCFLLRRSHLEGAVAVEGDVVVSVRHGRAIRLQADENNALDSQDCLMRDHVTYLGAHRYGGSTNGASPQSHLDDVAFAGRGNEVNFRHVFRNNVAVTELDYGVNSGLFVYPAKKATAKECSVRIQVLGTHPFSGVKVYVIFRVWKSTSSRDASFTEDPP